MNEKGKLETSFFTLIELMIVVAIMAIVAAIYGSNWSKDRSSLVKECAMQMEDVVMAVKMYKLNNGEYPKNAGTGEAVPELDGFVRDDFSFSNTPPVGGQWKFHTTSNKKGYIQIFSPTFTTNEMTMLDAFIDDGDLKTGDFIQVGQHYDYKIWDQK